MGGRIEKIKRCLCIPLLRAARNIGSSALSAPYSYSFWLRVHPTEPLNLSCQGMVFGDAGLSAVVCVI